MENTGSCHDGLKQLKLIGHDCQGKVVQQVVFGHFGDLLREAVRKTKTGGLLELTVANGRSISKYKLNYHGGEKYPMLQRNGQAGLIDDILKPLTR